MSQSTRSTQYVGQDAITSITSCYCSINLQQRYVANWPLYCTTTTAYLPVCIQMINYRAVHRRSPLAILQLSISLIQQHRAAQAEANQTTPSTSTADTSSRDNLPPTVKRFKLLAEKIRTSDASISINAESTCVSATIQSQLNRYIEEVRSSPTDANALQFWNFWSSRHSSYPLLAPLAEDLLAAPASQAYVERIFSLCGLLTEGRRNRMPTNLAIRVFFKLNKKLMK